jgi:hypothetical protein
MVPATVPTVLSALSIALRAGAGKRQDEDIDQRGCRDLTDIDDDEPRLVNELLATSPGNIRARQFHQSALVLLAPLYQWLSVMQPAHDCTGHKPRRVAPGGRTSGRRWKGVFAQACSACSSSRIASPICVVFTAVVPSDLMSAVRRPFASTAAMAASSLSASSPMSNE